MSKQSLISTDADLLATPVPTKAKQGCIWAKTGYTAFVQWQELIFDRGKLRYVPRSICASGEYPAEAKQNLLAAITSRGEL